MISGGRREGYLEKTHRPLNCLVFVLPLILANLIGIVSYGNRLLVSHHIGRLFGFLGLRGFFIPAAVVIVSLLLWHLVGRYRWEVDGIVLAGMVFESVVGTLPLFAAHLLTSRSLGSLMRWSDESVPKILSGIGAGVYEEFAFRLVGVGVVWFVLFRIFSVPKKIAIPITVVVISVLFSLYHFIGAEQFNEYRFLFRTFAGVYLAVVYLARGFAIAAGTHACYNAMVTVAW